MRRGGRPACARAAIDRRSVVLTPVPRSLLVALALTSTAHADGLQPDIQLAATVPALARELSLVPLVESSGSVLVEPSGLTQTFARRHRTSFSAAPGEPLSEGYLLGVQQRIDVVREDDGERGDDRLGLVFGIARGIANGEGNEPIADRIPTGSLSIDAFNAGLYVTHRRARWHATALASAAFLQGRVRGEGDGIRAQADGVAFAAGLEIGPLIETATLAIEPRGLLGVQRGSVSASSDGAERIRYDAAGVVLSGARIRLRARRGIVLPFVDAGVRFRFTVAGDRASGVDPTPLTIETESWLLAAEASAGIAAQLSKTFWTHIAADVSGALAGLDSRVYGVSFGISLRW